MKELYLSAYKLELQFYGVYYVHIPSFRSAINGDNEVTRLDNDSSTNNGVVHSDIVCADSNVVI